MREIAFKFIIIAGIVLLQSCSEDESSVSPNQIELSESEIEVEIGKVKAVTVQLNPENAIADLSWTSGNENVAVVQYNESGLVAGIKGVSEGETSFLVKSGDGNLQQTLGVNVTVTKVQSISIEMVERISSSQKKYRVLFTPENTSIKTISWESDQPEIASVDSDGIVTALSSGRTQITARSTDGDKTASVTIEISGDTPIFWYAPISGSGAYNAETVTTEEGVSNINYVGGQPAQNYEYYSDEKLSVNSGGSFTLSLSQSNTWSRSVVWIDWNGNKDFEDQEKVIEFGIAGSLNEGPFSGTVEVPADAVPGLSRMRIQTLDAWVDYSAYGLPVESTCTKDFDIEIQ